MTYPALTALALAALIGAPALARPADDAVTGALPVVVPANATDTPARRCTADGRICITAESYVPDVCAAIELAAGDVNLDPHFFARLLWKESLFEPSAISPAGAQGIAQFMPETARIVGLDDPYNPAKAIVASARYLRQLSDGFGNLGLAAVAYNGGESRAARFIAGGTVLPWETQDYVEAITGENAWKWRDEPPEKVDLRLKGDTPFHDACVSLAAKRALKEFKTPERVWPWGVILASHPRQSGAASQVNRLNRQLRPLLAGKRVAYVRKRISGMPKTIYTAQVGYSSKTEAFTFCSRLRAAGGKCLVLKNR
ncbi:lytic transglycosylase domain-containing protein [Paracoccus suum]|uniref:Lytic transglycosylase domain-containing protein n=1 Tax=Paracoccus suum TaxID=2259340 RepID=A0A344PGK0_9RHOB|nr:lytic transglycosylase domain-containing protein [Paracoccus suum]AXC48505.1 lytic transglycosylase domain-containing protein [Paracoccus suum]